MSGEFVLMVRFLFHAPCVGDTNSEACGGEKLVTSGRVVGILQRNWRDYVASLTDDEVGGTSL